MMKKLLLCFSLLLFVVAQNDEVTQQKIKTLEQTPLSQQQFLEIFCLLIKNDLAEQDILRIAKTTSKYKWEFREKLFQELRKNNCRKFLTTVLYGEDPTLTVYALIELSEMGNFGMEHVTSMMEHSSSSVRSYSLRYIKEKRYKPAIPKIMTFLEKRTYSRHYGGLHIRALDAIEVMEATEAIPSVIEALGTKARHNRVQHRALLLLVKFGKAAIPHLVKRIKKGDEKYVIDAIWHTFYWMGKETEEVIPTLIELYKQQQELSLKIVILDNIRSILIEHQLVHKKDNLNYEDHPTTDAIHQAMHRNQKLLYQLAKQEIQSPYDEIRCRCLGTISLYENTIKYAIEALNSKSKIIRETAIYVLFDLTTDLQIQKKWLKSVSEKDPDKELRKIAAEFYEELKKRRKTEEK